MVVIHIQEVNSDQVVEVTAKDIKHAILAYAEHNAFDWRDLYHYTITVNTAVFYFHTEKLTITNLYGNRYIAVWSNV